MSTRYEPLHLQVTLDDPAAALTKDPEYLVWELGYSFWAATRDMLEEMCPELYEHVADALQAAWDGHATKRPDLLLALHEAAHELREVAADLSILPDRIQRSLVRRTDSLVAERVELAAERAHRAATDLA